MDETAAIVHFALGTIHNHGSLDFRLLPDRPDVQVRSARAIDFLATTAGGVRLGVEHTRLEPYEGFLADWKLAHERLGPVRAILGDRLPQDSDFDISFRPATAARISTRRAAEIAEWINQVAPDLGSPPKHFATAPRERFGVELTIYRWRRLANPPRGPQIRYRIGLDLSNFADRLARRCRRAMEDKLPKLEEARSTYLLDQTLLCLESSDLQLTDSFALANVLHRTSNGFSLPDWIIMVVLGPDGRPFMSWTYRASRAWLQWPTMYSSEVVQDL